MKKRITLFHEPGFDDTYLKRQPIVKVTTKDGNVYRDHIKAVRGRRENPMTRQEVGQKSLDLTGSVLGEEKARKLIDTVMNLEHIDNMRELQPLISA